MPAVNEYIRYFLCINFGSVKISSSGSPCYVYVQSCDNYSKYKSIEFSSIICILCLIYL